MVKHTIGRSSHHWISISIVVVLWSALLPTSAMAGNNDMIDPDNVDHYIDRNSLTAQGDAAVSQGIEQLDRTKMDATLSGSGDVEVYDAYYGDSGFWEDLEGYAECYEKNYFPYECDKWSVKFNDTNLGTWSDWRSIGCHEFGHTAGLSHRASSNDAETTSCMRAAPSSEVLDLHDIDVINDDV